MTLDLLIISAGCFLEQVHAAHEFKRRITEEDLYVYVKDYLEKFCQGHQFHQLKADELTFDIRLPAKSAAALDDFIRRRKLSDDCGRQDRAFVTHHLSVADPAEDRVVAVEVVSYKRSIL